MSFMFPNLKRSCLRFHSTVPKPTTLPHNSMAVCLRPLSEPRAESSLLEMNAELRSQLARSKQDLRDLKEKLFVSEATAYFLANHLQETSKCPGS